MFLAAGAILLIGNLISLGLTLKMQSNRSYFLPGIRQHLRVCSGSVHNAVFASFIVSGPYMSLFSSVAFRL